MTNIDCMYLEMRMIKIYATIPLILPNELY